MENGERGQFTFYSSFAQAAWLIADKSQRCDFYDAVTRYALRGEEPDLAAQSEVTRVAFQLIRANLDAGRRKAEQGRQGGGLYRKSKQGQEQDKGQDKDKDKDKVQVKVQVKDKGQKPFSSGGKKVSAGVTYDQARLARNIAALKAAASRPCGSSP